MPSWSPVYRSLAALHRAGLTWSAALAAAQEEHGGLAAAGERVARGEPLAPALAPLVPGLDAAVLAAGERSGRLAEALDGLAERHDAERRRRGERRAALAYPVLLAHVAALLLPLPDLLAGRLLPALAWALLALGPLHLALWWARRGPAGAGPLPYRFPYVSRVEEQDAQALEALGRLYDAGLPLLEALPLARAAGPRGRVASDLRRAEARVAEGLDLAGAWHDLPATLSAPLRTAEQAGTLGSASAQAAERLAFEADMRRRRWAARLPPLLVLGLGALVGARVLLFYLRAYGALLR